MFRKYFLSLSLFISIVFLSFDQLYAEEIQKLKLQNQQTANTDSSEEKQVDFTIRWGEGGFLER